MAWQTMYPANPGSPYTTLALGIDEDDTSISLTTDPGFAAATNLACIWDDTGNFEVVKYTDLTGTTLTVERAFEGSARAWSAGAYIANLIPAYAINSLQNNVNELNSGKIAASGVTYENLNANGDVGSSSGTVCAGDDARLSDSRTPTSHGNEAHSSAFLTSIDIHGTLAETSIADDDEVLIYDTSASANRRMTRANLVAGLSGGGTGGTGISWTEITGTSQTAAVNTGYIANNAGLVTVTLPATAALGSIIRVAGYGAGGWAIAQNAGQQIVYGDVVTTEGVSGSLASINRYDAVELLCVVANTKFVVISGVGTVEVA